MYGCGFLKWKPFEMSYKMSQLILNQSGNAIHSNDAVRLNYGRRHIERKGKPHIVSASAPHTMLQYFFKHFIVVLVECLLKRFSINTPFYIMHLPSIVWCLAHRKFSNFHSYRPVGDRNTLNKEDRRHWHRFCFCASLFFYFFVALCEFRICRFVSQIESQQHRLRNNKHRLGDAQSNWLFNLCRRVLLKLRHFSGKNYSRNIETCSKFRMPIQNDRSAIDCVIFINVINIININKQQHKYVNCPHLAHFKWWKDWVFYVIVDCTIMVCNFDIFQYI